ncbi:MAG: domain S-box protein [Bacteroidetes bacterium]|nr:domain S-box protein [Bacteroidota bacterium]
MSNTLKILHVEDIQTDAELVKRELQKSGISFESLWVPDKETYVEALEHFNPDVIICDHSLPSFTSTDALKILNDTGKRIPFILVTATISESFLVSMVKNGVDDYLLKDRLQRLPTAVLNAVEKVSAEKDKDRYYHEVISQEKKFRALIENISDAILLLNRKGEIIYRSPSATTITGFLSEEVLHKKLDNSFHPDDLTEARHMFKHSYLCPGVVMHESFRILHKNGNYIWVEGSITNLLHDENVNAFIVNYRDITERKKAEKLLQKSEANLKAIYNNTEVSYVLLDKKLNILAFNERTSYIYKRLSGEEFVEGIDFLSLSVIKRIRHVNEKLLKVLKGKKINFETEGADNDGVMIWLSVSLVPVLGDENNVIGVVVSTEDITERKRDELQKEKMTSEIIRHNKNLEQFAYIISHNLRSPVANIIGLSNMIHSTPNMKSEDFKRCMDGLEVSVKKLDDTIIDLNFILQTRKEINEKKERVYFTELINDIKTSINHLLEGRDITIKTDFSELNEFTTIKSYIHSIFYNLISNSIKYRDPHKPALIEINSKVHNSKLVISFKDNGLGIDTVAHKNTIFGLYKKFHPQIEGKGMGLYMVKTQVEMLEGYIKIISAVDKGTEFVLEFPLHDSVAQESKSK